MMMTHAADQSGAQSARTADKRRRWLRAAAVAAFAVATVACASPEERAEKHYQNGQEYLDKEQWGKANVEFRNVLKIDETNVPALLGLAKIAEHKADFKGMFGLYQRIVRLAPDNVFAQVQIGKLFLLGKDAKSALEHAEKALALEPDNPDAMSLKAGVLLQLGDADNAVKIARAVLDKHPDNTEASVIIVTNFMQSKQQDQALAELERILALKPESAILQLMRIELLAQMNRSDDVLAAFEGLIKQFPEEPAYRRAYARALIKNKDLAGAAKQYDAIVSITPSDVKAKIDAVRFAGALDGAEAAEAKLQGYIKAEPDNYELKFALAEFLVQQKNWDKAYEVLNPLMESTDQGVAATAKNKVAALKLFQGDREAAETLINDILAADENNTQALIKRAGLQIDDGDYDQAIANLRTALNNDPESSEAMMLMSAAFERQGNIEFARSQIAKAFDASGKSARVANYYAKFLIRHDEPSRAEDILVQSLSAHAGDMNNLEALAAVRLQQQDWSGAEEVAKIIDSLNKDSDNGVARNIRTLAYGGQGEYDQIIDMLSNESEKAPLESRPLATLVNAYLRSNRAEDAEAMLNNVLASQPDNYLARILMAQVKGARGDNDGVEQTLIKATEADPQQATGYELLYRYYVSAGQPEKASALIDAALKRLPDNDILLFYKADTLLRDNKREEAYELYSSLLDKRPNDKIVMNNFVSLSGELYDDPQHIERALEVARLLEKEASPSVQDTVGWAYFQAKQYDRALEFLSKAADADSGNAEILYHLGAAQIAAGDVENGKESLKKALAAGGEGFRFESEIHALMGRE